ncbi:hypothetical protein [Roseibium aggregatum]|uniref:PemK-like, MazF-like toxin of type II toxin-antitoxin system n=1 Tax=Roseibium aggregatum TaxID=187304 RepID=A0A0M6YDD6_9HYPH|nr:hypothetical protein [Roseibium aggregatum]CTQ47698.1 hypothetical protein LAL4801_06160 [Roseibium aggregatum]
MRVGQVYRYWFLFYRRYKAGHEEAEKHRPACVLVRRGDLCFVFPISKSIPRPMPEHGLPERTWLEVPQSERRRIGLRDDAQSYVALDEFNAFRVSRCFDLEDTRPMGEFSARFTDRLAEMVEELINERRPTLPVPR